jgi:hypothetical protein
MKSLSEKILTKILSTVIIILPFMFIFSTPIPSFGNFGIWSNTELSGIVLNISVFIIGFILSFLLIKKNIIVSKILFHPIPISLIILSIWSLLFLPFVKFKSRDFFGLPEIQQGFWWFSELTIILYGYLFVSLRVKRIATISSIMALFVIDVLTYLSIHYSKNYSPESNNYNLAFLALFVLSSSLANFKEGKPLVRVLRIFSLFTFVVSILLTGNNIALFFMLIFFFVIYASRINIYFDYKQNIFLNNRKRITILSLIMVPFLIFSTYFIGEWYQGYYIKHGQNAVQENLVASVASIDHKSIQNGILGPIWQREQLSNLIKLNIEEKPQTFLIGNGWNSFRDINTKEDYFLEGRSFPFTQPPTSSRTYNNLYQKADFSPYSLFLEAFNSLGIIGLFLFSTVISSIVFYSKRKRRYPAIMLTFGLVFLGSFGYLINIDIPFLALGIASVVVQYPSLKKINKEKIELFKQLPVLSIITTISFIIAISLIQIGVNEQKEKNIFANNTSQSCGIINNIFLPTQEINTDLFLEDLENTSKNNSITNTNLIESNPSFFKNLQCSLNKYKGNNLDIYTLYISLESRTILMDMSNKNDMPDYLNSWFSDIKLFLKMAPNRKDVLMPYISYLNHTKNIEQLKIVKTYVDQNFSENDPFMLWIDGSYEGLTTHSVAGYIKLLDALQLGVANYYPVSLKEYNTFRAYNMLPILKAND